MLDAQLKQLGNNPEDHAMVQPAYKILSGERYSVSTGDSGLIDRCRSLAKDLGATIEDGTTGSGHNFDLSGRNAAARMSVTIVPPAKGRTS